MNGSFTDEYWMEIALSYAQHAYKINEVPVGAIIVLNNEVIGTGYNKPIANNDPTSHAEINAIRNAGSRISNYRLVGATIYVTLEPCTMCFGAMLHARISRLVYGAKESKSGVIDSNFHLNGRASYNHTLDVQGGVLEGRSSKLLKRFFAERRESKQLGSK
jgi:tRNA(adenine34) deaminase